MLLAVNVCICPSARIKPTQDSMDTWPFKNWEHNIWLEKDKQILITDENVESQNGLG